MNTHFLCILVLFWSTQIIAQPTNEQSTHTNRSDTISDLDTAAQKANQAVDNYLDMLESSIHQEVNKFKQNQQNFRSTPEILAVKEILASYSDEYSRELINWIDIVEQIYGKIYYGDFIYRTQPIIRSSLSIRYLKDDLPFTDKEYQTIKNWLNSLLNSDVELSKQYTRVTYELKKDISELNFRKLPIIMEETKIIDNTSPELQYITIKEKDKVNVLFSIDFINADGTETTWSYVELPQKNYITGWCNMRYLQKPN